MRFFASSLDGGSLMYTESSPYYVQVKVYTALSPRRETSIISILIYRSLPTSEEGYRQI